MPEEKKVDVLSCLESIAASLEKAVGSLERIEEKLNTSTSKKKAE